MGLKKRIERETKKMRFRSTGTPKLDIRRRHPVLLRQDRWHELAPYMANIVVRDQLITDLKYEYERSGSSQKFTRWLLRNKGLSEAVISDIGQLNVKEPIRFRISCRHNDLMRLGETNHYSTCMKQWRGIQQLRYLADPDVAIVYVSDAAGKFQWRSLLRLVLTPDPEMYSPNKYSLLSYRPYGNALEFVILWWIDRMVLPLYVAHTTTSLSCRMNLGDPQVDLYSATEINNKCLDRPVWSDHGANKDRTTNRIKMTGSRFNLEAHRRAYIARYLPAYWRCNNGTQESSVSVSEGLLHHR